MNIIDKMIIGRVATLLNELSGLSIEAIDELERKKTSTFVSDFTTADELPLPILIRIGQVQMEITMLKNLLSDTIDIPKT